MSNTSIEFATTGGATSYSSVVLQQQLEDNKDQIIECLGGLEQIISLCITNPTAKNLISVENLQILKTFLESTEPIEDTSTPKTDILDIIDTSFQSTTLKNNTSPIANTTVNTNQLNNYNGSIITNNKKK